VAAAREWAKAQGQLEEGEGQGGQKDKPVANGSAAAHDVEWVRGALASLQADMEQVGGGGFDKAVLRAQLHCKDDMAWMGMGQAWTR
jgi:hypothetical protein